MPISKEIKHIYEPNPLACGQAAISMATGLEVEEIIKLCGTERETDLKTMKRVFSILGVAVVGDKKPFAKKEDLPKVALLSLETPKCWHWSLYASGRFYDPEYGEIEEIPPSNRKFFWELKDL